MSTVRQQQTLTSRQRRTFISREFSDAQMRAYFTKDDSLKRLIFRIALTLAAFCFICSILFFGYFFYFDISSLICMITALIVKTIINSGIVVPTDKEYETWIEEQARFYLLRALDKIHQGDLTDEEIDQILSVRGFVLAGTKNAKKYREQDVLNKLGRDKNRHYSINVYTYFLPVEHQLAVFVFDINVVNRRDFREGIHEYFYSDIVAAMTEDEQDEIISGGQAHSYRTLSFALRICDGNRITATFRSVPLDYEQNLPTYNLPSGDVEATIAQLRFFLRAKKQ